MADLPVMNADPPAAEEPPTKRSKLEIDDGADNDKICLSDLHQCYIDRTARYMTCKDLSMKGFIAQRLLTCRLEVEYTRYGLHLELPDYNSRRLTYKQLKATNCRLRADIFSWGWHSTLEIMQGVTEILDGRGVVDNLTALGEMSPDVDHIIFSRFLQGDLTLEIIGKVKGFLKNRRSTVVSLTVYGGLSPEEDLNLFSQFLQNFKINSLSVSGMIEECLQLSAVKQMKYLYTGTCPMHVRYFLDNDIPQCKAFLDDLREHRPDSAELHKIMEKWTRNERVIEWLQFLYFNWDVESLFFGWRIVYGDEEIPPERPIVTSTDVDSDDFKVIRADGACLRVQLADYEYDEVIVDGRCL